MDISENVTQINIAFLTLLRECHTRDPDLISVYFGVSDDIAKLVADCPPTELHKIAKSGVLLFQPRTPLPQFRRLINSRGASAEVVRTVASSLASS